MIEIHWIDFVINLIKDFKIKECIKILFFPESSKSRLRYSFTLRRTERPCIITAEYHARELQLALLAFTVIFHQPLSVLPGVDGYWAELPVLDRRRCLMGHHGRCEHSRAGFGHCEYGVSPTRLHVIHGVGKVSVISHARHGHVWLSPLKAVFL